MFSYIITRCSYCFARSSVHSNLPLRRDSSTNLDTSNIDISMIGSLGVMNYLDSIEYTLLFATCANEFADTIILDVIKTIFE